MDVIKRKKRLNYIRVERNDRKSEAQKNDGRWFVIVLLKRNGNCRVIFGRHSEKAWKRLFIFKAYISPIKIESP